MAKIMLIGREIWAWIESNTGTKTVAIILMKLVAGFGWCKKLHSHFRLEQTFHKTCKTWFRRSQQIQPNSVLKTKWVKLIKEFTQSPSC